MTHWYQACLISSPSFILVGGAIGPDPVIGIVQPLLARQLRLERKRAVDPAEGVEQVAGDTGGHVAVDGVAEVLLGGL